MCDEQDGHCEQDRQPQRRQKWTTWRSHNCPPWERDLLRGAARGFSLAPHLDPIGLEPADPRSVGPRGNRRTCEVRRAAEREPSDRGMGCQGRTAAGVCTCRPAPRGPKGGGYGLGAQRGSPSVGISNKGDPLRNSYPAFSGTGTRHGAIRLPTHLDFEPSAAGSWPVIQITQRPPYNAKRPPSKDVRSASGTGMDRAPTVTDLSLF